MKRLDLTLIRIIAAEALNIRKSLQKIASRLST